MPLICSLEQSASETFVKASKSASNRIIIHTKNSGYHVYLKDPGAPSLTIPNTSISWFSELAPVVKLTNMRSSYRNQSKHGPLVTAFLRDMAALRQEALRSKAYMLLSQSIPIFDISECQPREGSETKIPKDRKMEGDDS